MKTVALERLVTGTHGTFGRLTFETRWFWTVEETFTGPHPAIPAGTYRLMPGVHHAGRPDSYPCYWVEDVPGRTAIQIHVGNIIADIEGCICPGQAVTWFKQWNQLGISGSADAFKEFMGLMAGDVGTLTITENF